MKKIEINVNEKDLEILKKERKSNIRKVREKASAIYFRTIGYSEEKIREATGLSVTTILSHIKNYKTYGIEYIYTTNYKKKTAILDPYADEIKHDFESNPPQTIAEAITRIKDKFGVEIKDTAMRNFLKKKGLHTKKQEAFHQKQTKKNKKNF